uniref:Nucleocapsid protein n=1 Tax=Panagrellus redivivus TaxID=6233 RepID=A0A7E4V9R4_PANRE
MSDLSSNGDYESDELDDVPTSSSASRSRKRPANRGAPSVSVPHKKPKAKSAETNMSPIDTAVKNIGERSRTIQEREKQDLINRFKGVCQRRTYRDDTGRVLPKYPSAPPFNSPQGNQYQELEPSLQSIGARIAAGLNGSGQIPTFFHHGLHTDYSKKEQMFMIDKQSTYYLPAATIKNDDNAYDLVTSRAVAAIPLIVDTRIWQTMKAYIEDAAMVPPTLKKSVLTMAYHTLCTIAGFGEGIYANGATEDILRRGQNPNVVPMGDETKFIGSYKQAEELLGMQAPRLVVVMLYNSFFRVGRHDQPDYGIKKIVAAGLLEMARFYPNDAMPSNSVSLPGFHSLIASLFFKMAIHNTCHERFFYYLNNPGHTFNLIGMLKTADLHVFSPAYYGGAQVCGSRAVMNILDMLHQAEDMTESKQQLDDFIKAVTENNNLGFIRFGSMSHRFFDTDQNTLPSYINTIVNDCSAWAAALQAAKRTIRSPVMSELPAFDFHGLANRNNNILWTKIYEARINLLFKTFNYLYLPHRPLNNV